MSSSRSSGRSITSSRSSATSKSGAVNRLTTSVSGQSERQKTLNKFLGLPLEHYQIKVDSLFRKQERLSRESVSSRDLHTVSIAGAAAARSRNHSKDIMEISSDVEDNGALKQSKANGKKRRVVDSSDVEEEDDRGSTKPKKAATPSATTASQTTETLDTGAENESKSMSNGESAKKKLKTDEASKSVKETTETTTKATSSTKPKEGQKLASIFETSKPKKTSAAKVSSSEGRASENSGKATSSMKSKGKSKEEGISSNEEDGDNKAPASTSDGEDGHVSGVDANGNEEHDDSQLESEEEEEQAVKLAEIFTKKVAGSSKGKYGKSIQWKSGAPVPYAALAEVFERIDSTTKRLEIAEYLTEFLRTVIETTSADLIKVVYLCINRICPDYEGLELGIGEGLLKKAIAQATGSSIAGINAQYKQVGDLGLVAMNSRNTQKTLFAPKALTVAQVFNKLKEIAKTTGASSQNKKVGTINGLLAACQGQEAKFIIRSLEGKLRIGLAEQTVLGSLAAAIVAAQHAKSGKNLSKEKVVRDLEEGSKIVKSVFSECPSYDKVIPPLLEGGPRLLAETIKLTPGIPLKPMLAKPTKAITEVLDRFEGKKFTCEYKYDGERAQVHYYDGKLSVFSRNSEDMSVKYPDLIDHMQKCIKPDTGSFVLDAEAVAWDHEAKKILPFQELSKRKRKDVKAEDIKVKVHIFAFDLLYLNGETLLRKDLAARRQLLLEHFVPVEGQFAFAKSNDAHSVEEIQAFLDESIKDSCEGLMVKMLEGEDATYEPSRRSMNWLKLKKDYLAGIGDSFDLVVIGGYYGRGKRTSVYGAFLLACYDPESETYQAITKIGTGFSEEMLDSHHKFLNPLECSKKAYYDVGEAKPDIFFEPKMLWEVLAADLSLSPVYSAAKGLIEARGISLRFPRFIRIRDDKDPEDASSAEFVAEAYQKQAAAVGAGGGKRKGNDDGDGFW